jgi:hypothetical protein
MLEQMKDIEIAEPMVTILSRLKPENNEAMETLADTLAK